MKNMSAGRPELAEVVFVGDRQALLLPEGYPTLPVTHMILERDSASLRLFPCFEDWASMDEPPAKPTADD